MHHLNVSEANTGMVLKEARVEEKAGELTHLDLFLTPVLLHGRIISADALFTQHHFCQQVLASGADYLLVVKLTQPTLHEDVSLFFQDPLWTASIGVPPAPATQGMGVWKIVSCGPRPNSMTFWHGIGLELGKSSVYDDVWNMPSSVHRRVSMASPVSPRNGLMLLVYWN